MSKSVANPAVDYDELIQPGRIHGSVHFDPRIYADEIERIWRGGWVYVGHDSEVPEPGTYVRKELGTDPVILTRDTEGQLHVLYNRCAHLGNQLAHEECGAANALRCPFHGWAFALDGSNLGVPYIHGYGPDFDKTAYHLGRPARVASYRGFVFASATPDVPELVEWLGPVTTSIDELCDLSPLGEIELTSGWIKHRVHANWKIGLEAALDGYHPRFVHRGLISLTEGSNFAASTDSCAARIRSLGNGHGDVDWHPYYRDLDREFVWMGATREKVPTYVHDLEARYGPERAHHMLIDGPPHVMVCPNLFIAELFIMVLVPVSPTEHLQIEAPIQWKGASELNRRNLRQTAASIGPAGMVLADDAAMSERNQKGLQAGQPEWLIRRRGEHRRERVDDGMTLGRLTDDAAILGFWEHYRNVMVGA